MGTIERYHATSADSEDTRKRTRYFDAFIRQHLSEARILRRGGVLGKEHRDWRNVSEHCLVEAVAADILAEHLGANREVLVRAALLHDWYKPQEVRAIKERGRTGYDAVSAEDEQLLAENGVPENVIALTRAVLPESIDQDYLARRTLEERIMHYIDAMTNGFKLEEDFAIRNAVVRQKPGQVEWSDSFKDRFGGKSLFDVQAMLVEEEQEAFEQALGLEPKTLIRFIKEKLRERIENAS